MIGLIEQKIIDRISFLNDQGYLGYDLKEIKTYGGEVNNQASRARVKRYPAVWVVFDDAPIKKFTNQADKFVPKFFLIVAAKSLRNEKSARHGHGEGEVGAYQIALDMVSILSGWKPDQCVDSLKATHIKALSVNKNNNNLLAVYAISFETGFSNIRTSPDVIPTTGDGDENSAKELKIIHTNWDLPPNGEVGAELPDDDNADATSHIEKET